MNDDKNFRELDGVFSYVAIALMVVAILFVGYLDGLDRIAQ